MIKQVFGEQSMSHTHVFEWHALLRASHTAIEEEHPRRPISSTIPIAHLYCQSSISRS